MNESPPEKEFKIGPVRAVVWSNQRTANDGRTFNSTKVSFERTYRDSNGSFKTTSSFDMNDLPKLIIAIKRAYEYLALRNSQNNENNNIANNQPFNRIP